MDIDGTIISSVLSQTLVKTDTKLAQIQALLNAEKQVQISRALIQTKIQRSIQVFNGIARKCDITEHIKMRLRPDPLTFK
jgi:hypothetical protein